MKKFFTYFSTPQSVENGVVISSPNVAYLKGRNLLYVKEAKTNTIVTLDGNNDITTVPVVTCYYNITDTTSATTLGSAILENFSHMFVGGVQKTISQTYQFDNEGIQIVDFVLKTGVSTIVEYAFENCEALIGIAMSDEIKEVESYAFNGCTNLEDVEFSKNITSIGESAFKACANLETLIIPEGVTNIGLFAFCECTSLSNITIPKTVNQIGEYAFDGCSSLPVENNIRYADTYLVEAVDKTLNEYTIKNNTRFIGSVAFYECENIETIDIPLSVISIGEDAFNSCINLIEINISAYVKHIGLNAFNACSNLESIVVNRYNRIYDSRENCNAIIETETNVLLQGCNNTTIPNTVVAIEANAFMYCFGLPEIMIIPDSVLRIGENAFENCMYLNKISLPKYLEYVGACAFKDCSNLSAIVINAKIPPVLENINAFENTNNCPIYVPSIGDYESAEVWSELSGRFVVSYSNQYLTFDALDNAMFGFQADYNCGELQYSLDEGATWNNYNIEGEPDQIEVSQGNKILWKGLYKSGQDSNFGYFLAQTEEGFNVSGNIMSLLYGDEFQEEITLQNKSFIFEEMFNNLNVVSAENLILPATTLANGCYSSMFNGCSSLTTAPELPATTLAENCYNGMFSSCTSLTTAPATLPAATLASSCYQYMFNNCTSLTTAPALPATTLAENCYNGMFSSCTSLTTAPALPATTLASGCYDSMFDSCTNLATAPALPATTLAIGCYASMFSNCTSLTTAPELPATTLANYCYNYMLSNCTSLTTAPELPATTLAENCYDSMFSGCISLTTAPVLPAATLASSCYRYMFYGCTSLIEITCLATNISANYCTYNWVINVSSTGTFKKNSVMGDWITGDNGIPSGWTVVDM